MNYNNLLNNPEYAFLRSHPRLGKRIMLLGVSGSRGYGTDTPDSDIDLRGVTQNLPSDLLGLTSFEQYEDARTDTVIYSFSKLVTLLLSCNPNTIEILGLDEDQYLIVSPLGRELLNHKSLFLSKRAASSFGNYAGDQLRRLQNAIARDALPQSDQEKHILRSVRNALEDFNRRHDNDGREKIKLYIDAAETPELETEIFLDAEFRHYPLRRYNDLLKTLGNVIRSYKVIGHRNRKKDANHLNKHAMHLVRLFMMGIDILEKGEIRTHRPEADLRLLRAVRSGDYMRDGILTPDFYEIAADYEKRFAEAVKSSPLPDCPDMDKVGRFVENINRQIVKNVL